MFGLITCLLFVAVSPSQAELLDLSRLHYPLVVSNPLDVGYVYDSGSGTGVLTGWWQEFFFTSMTVLMLQMHEDDQPEDLIENFGRFELQVELDSSGEIVLGGSHGLLVAWDPGTGEEILFQSTILSDFGYAGSLFEFLFVCEGGTLAAVGETLAVQLNDGMGSNDDPLFDQSFQNVGFGYSNTFYLPEPATIALLTVGAVTILGRCRRNRGA